MLDIKAMTRKEHEALHRLSAGGFDIEETCYGVRYITNRDPRIDPGHERFIYAGQNSSRTEYVDEAEHMTLSRARSVLLDLKVLSYKPGGEIEWADAEIFRFDPD